MISEQKLFFVQLAEQQGFTVRIIQDFQDIKCGIPHLIPELDLRWAF